MPFHTVVDGALKAVGTFVLVQESLDLRSKFRVGKIIAEKGRAQEFAQCFSGTIDLHACRCGGMSVDGPDG